MTRQLLWFCLGACLLALLPAPDARAVEMPVRKPGLWELKMVRTGSPMPEMTMQHCTDETIDKAMTAAASPMSKEVCSKNDIQKTATGYVSDSECSVAGMSMTSHSEITGDFNSAYTVKTTSHSAGGPAGSAARRHDDDRGEVAGGLQTRSEARRHRDARRVQAQHQGRGKAQGADAEVSLPAARPAAEAKAKLRQRRVRGLRHSLSENLPRRPTPTLKATLARPRRRQNHTGIRTAARRPPIGLSPSVMSPP